MLRGSPSSAESNASACCGEGHHAGHVTALPGNERLQGRRRTAEERAIGGGGLLLMSCPTS